MGVTLSPGSIDKLLEGDYHRSQMFQVMDLKIAGREFTFKDDGGVENKKWYKLLLSDALLFIEVGISDEVNEIVRSKQKGSIVWLKKFLWDGSFIIINKLNVISHNPIIPGGPNPFQVKTSIPSISLDSDVNDDDSEDEPTAPQPKCSSSQSQSKK
ncbi:hypothetical protein Tco_0633728 [Tanacetum coccineum]